MIRSLVSVGGMTLLSRATGFLRDVVLGAVLGAGFMADAFVVAFRLPNHFRAIFGEGAFNAAYVPTYSRALQTEGRGQARAFSGQMFALMLAIQMVVLALALAFTPELVRLLAPGFADEPAKFDLAVRLTRITFPYLLCLTLVTLVSATLNAHERFAAAAFAPVLLNLGMIAALALAFLFPNAAYAAAAGVCVSGVAQLALVMADARRASVLAAPARPRWTPDTKQFLKTIIPAVIGSAGVQIAIFADTIIGSLLPTGGVSSIYYADRIYQLPIGVIGIAAGTVVLPEMSRRFAAGDPGAAFHAQNRAMAITIALSAPFLVAFLTIPDLIMRGVFVRGAFTEAEALAAGAVLAAYGFGLMAVVLIRSAVASFQARGDTKTPMTIALAAVAINVALKIVLFRPLGAPGLALATAVGAWINFGLLTFLALRRGDMRFDALFCKIVAASAAASALLAIVALVGRDAAAGLRPMGAFSGALAGLAALGAVGALAYAAAFAGALRLFHGRVAIWRRA
jgi:putative peptidoglycan lipid II flippase